MGHSETMPRVPSSLRILAWMVSITLLISLNITASAVPLEGQEDGGDSKGTPTSISPLLAPTAARIKRSRDGQQVCGYRLLDALRSACDRNFVGLAKKSGLNSLLRSSGEEMGSGIYFDSDSGAGQWEVLGLGEEGSYIASPTVATFPGNSASLLEYLEPSASASSWGSNGIPYGAPSSNKAFALKMLGSSPKTHQRFRRTIIDECCMKPCTTTQMLKYCSVAGAGK